MLSPGFVWSWRAGKEVIIFWLVVSTPLNNICQLGWLSPIYGKIKTVPNHQPVFPTSCTLAASLFFFENHCIMLANPLATFAAGMWLLKVDYHPHRPRCIDPNKYRAHHKKSFWGNHHITQNPGICRRCSMSSKAFGQAPPVTRLGTSPTSKRKLVCLKTGFAPISGRLNGNEKKPLEQW